MWKEVQCESSVLTKNSAQWLQSGLEPLVYSQSHRLEKTFSNQQFVGSSSIKHVSVFIVIRSCFVQLWSVCWTKSWSPYSGCIRWYQRTTQNLSDTSWHLVPHWLVLHLVVSWFNVLIFKNSGHVFSLKLYIQWFVHVENWWEYVESCIILCCYRVHVGKYPGLIVRGK